LSASSSRFQRSPPGGFGLTTSMCFAILCLPWWYVTPKVKIISAGQLGTIFCSRFTFWFRRTSWPTCRSAVIAIRPVWCRLLWMLLILHALRSLCTLIRTVGNRSAHWTMAIAFWMHFLWAMIRLVCTPFCHLILPASCHVFKWMTFSHASLWFFDLFQDSGVNCGVMVATWVVLRLGALVCFKFINHIKR
jgi:hypothetical protein